MKRIQRLAFSILILAVMSVNSLAGDFSTLNFIGFSRDGKYLAFEEYGVTDPDEQEYSNIYVVDTTKNDFAAPTASSLIKVNNDYDEHFEQPPDYSEPASRKRSRMAAVAWMKKFGIVAGNTGHQVISRLLTDVTDVNNEDVRLGEPKSVIFAPDRRERWLNGRFELTLKTVAQKQFCRVFEDLELAKFEVVNGESLPKISISPNRKKSDEEKQPLFSFELALKNDDANETTILQKALEVPVSRGCAIDYRIHSVYLYRDYIAVFIGVIKPGWAGDNIRLMVVTGQLKNL